MRHRGRSSHRPARASSAPGRPAVTAGPQRGAGGPAGLRHARQRLPRALPPAARETGRVAAVPGAAPRGRGPAATGGSAGPGPGAGAAGTCSRRERRFPAAPAPPPPSPPRGHVVFTGAAPPRRASGGVTVASLPRSAAAA